MAKFNPTVEEALRNASRRTGVPLATLRAFATVESGGRPDVRTGSYNGLFQLSREQFKKFGGSGNIFDPEQNAMAAAKKIRNEAQSFERSNGRPPTAFDLYMQHQQGPAGYRAHRSNPDAPAWENINRFYKSPAVAKQAVWGNLPAAVKKQYGSVENVPSRAFLADGWWGQRFSRAGGGDPKTPLAFANQTAQTRAETRVTPGTDPFEATRRMMLSTNTNPAAVQGMDDPMNPQISPIPIQPQTGQATPSTPRTPSQTSTFRPPQGMVDPVNPEVEGNTQPISPTGPQRQGSMPPWATEAFARAGNQPVDPVQAQNASLTLPAAPPSTDDWLMNKFPKMNMLFGGGNVFGGFFGGS